MKQVLPLLKSITLAIILAIGASYVSAQTTTPPGGTLPPPVHRLSGSQVKDGNLSVNGFLANQNALFNQDTFITGIIKGTYNQSDITSTVRIGTTGRSTDTITTGNVENTLALGSDTLKNTTSKTVCGSSGGRVVLCDTPFGNNGGGSGPLSITFDNSTAGSDPLNIKVLASQAITDPAGLSVVVRIDTSPVIGGTGITSSTMDYTIVIPNGQTLGSRRLQPGAYIITWKCIRPSPNYTVTGLLDGCGG